VFCQLSARLWQTACAFLRTCHPESGFWQTKSSSWQFCRGKICQAGQKNAPVGESGNRRPKRKKEKFIRLDDLIPKKDVVGGRQLLFGATDATQTTNKPTSEN
jgi:hypothetical protein